MIPHRNAGQGGGGRPQRAHRDTRLHCRERETGRFRAGVATRHERHLERLVPRAHELRHRDGRLERIARPSPEEWALDATAVRDRTLETV